MKNNNCILKSRFLYSNLIPKRLMAWIMLLIFSIEIFSPLKGLALTSGPSQPEMQSFEPVGSSEMVDLFTGDFKYNIPLLDIEGYPINISYHGGVGMEEEASWVGLGWNLNPGVVNHIVRGISDDNNGENIERILETDEEVDVNISAMLGAEVAAIPVLGEKTMSKVQKMLDKIGLGPSLSTELSVNVNNYKGVSANFGLDPSVKLELKAKGKQLNLSGGLATSASSTGGGQEIDYNINAALMSDKGILGHIGKMNASINGGLNTFDGCRNIGLGLGATMYGKRANLSTGLNGSYIPINMQCYSTKLQNATSGEGYSLHLKLGAAVTGLIYLYGKVGAAVNKIKTQNVNTRQSFGYLNLQNANKDALTDFSSSNQLPYMNGSKYLPLSGLDYDIYNVMGQGASGQFRAYRNDFGSVNDPSNHEMATNTATLVEVGILDLYEVGADVNTHVMLSSTNPWDEFRKGYMSKSDGSVFEPSIFKQAGELTKSNETVYDAVKNNRLISNNEFRPVVGSGLGNSKRTPRSSLMTFLRADEASVNQIAFSKDIRSGSSSISRVGGVRRANQISEITNTTEDGTRYIYGIPAMNNKQVDIEVAVPYSSSNYSNMGGTLPYPLSGNNIISASSSSNNKYKSVTTTPSYAHSYLLTEILSSDYSDITGNGISDDDIGNYTKFNYKRTSDKFKWKSPYQENHGMFNYGLLSNPKDDKVSVSLGSREQWYLESIVTKNFIAIFDISERLDGQGAKDNLSYFDNTTGSENKSFKLDKIRLYNKSEYNTNPVSARPIKIVKFEYTYELCKGVPNNSSTGVNNGKLTLKAIYSTNEKSDIGFLNPYKFTYGNNPNYDKLSQDCWGSYKPQNLNVDKRGFNLNNFEFPYVLQGANADLDNYASAWSLSKVNLPSGGEISVDYEMDDYSYVQNRDVMEMFRIDGIGETQDYTNSNILYDDSHKPNLYLYFKRDIAREGSNSNMKSVYLKNTNAIQLNSIVQVSDDYNSVAYKENIKCYAEVLDMGACSDGIHGFIRVKGVKGNSISKLDKVQMDGDEHIHPLTYSAINSARFYYPLSLNPSGAVDLNNLSIENLAKIAGKAISEYFSSRKLFKKMLLQGKCRSIDLSKSYARLNVPNRIKKGGGQRVKKIVMNDKWAGGEATYGSEYIYKTTDENGQEISSGVSCYEPLLGGNENPFKELLSFINFKGSKPSTLFKTDPILLDEEGPLGESFYPGASVGYSMVTVKSIHQNEGASSQSESQSEFYTSRDFPIIIENSNIDIIRNTRPRWFNVSPVKQEVLHLTQNYNIRLNDMNGKTKKTSTYVNRDSKKELISYTKYNYFTENDGTLSSNVPCLERDGSNPMPKLISKPLGVETEFLVNSNKKVDRNISLSGQGNLQGSSGSFGVPVPSFYFSFSYFQKEFATAVGTKTVQQYGIIKSIESYDKGALIEVENVAFDPETGRALITKTNTEHNDNEFALSYPAYWAYLNMAGGYQNIGYTESGLRKMITNKPIGKIENAIGYIPVSDLGKYNVGDELYLNVNASTLGGSEENLNYRVTVVDKGNWDLKEINGSSCNLGTEDVMYSDGTSCISFSDLKNKIIQFTNDPSINNVTDYFDRVEINYLDGQLSAATARGGVPCVTLAIFGINFGIYNAINILAPTISITNPLELINLGEHPFISYNANGIYPHKRSIVYKAQYSPQYMANHSAVFNSNQETELTYENFVDIMWRRRWKNDPNHTDGWESTFSLGHAINRSGVTITFKSNKSALLNSQIGSQYSNVILANGSIMYQNNLCPKRDFERKFNYRYERKAPLVTNVDKKPFIVVKARTKTEMPINSSSSLSFDVNRHIFAYKLKVLRSGRRNVLANNVQEISTVSNPISGNSLNSSFSNVLSAKSYVYDDNAIPMLEIHPNNQSNIYYNNYVMGLSGNYRVRNEYNIHKNRDYNSPTDRNKGMLNNIPSFWNFLPSSVDNKVNFMTPANASNWFMSNFVTAYSPWGIDLEVEDAIGNRHSNIMGYGYAMPIAVVQNSEYDQSINENFEDYYLYKLMENSPLKYYQNLLKRDILANLGISNMSGSVFDIINGGHTGNKALYVKSKYTANLPIDYGGVSGAAVPFLKMFSVRQGGEYILSYWSKGVNNAPKLYLTGNEVVMKSNKIKTPSIDGWIQYEARFAVAPNTINQNIYLEIPQGTYDDIRIMPAKANMKSYVYYLDNKKVAAILDENNMAMFYEYDESGNLVRIKRETEKGIITLKESRKMIKPTVQ